jgi:ComF family protein
MAAAPGLLPILQHLQRLTRFPSLEGVGAAARRALAPWCTVCGVQRVTPGALRTAAAVCGACRADYFAAGAFRCRICANRLPRPAVPGAGLDVCGQCLAQPPRFDATIVLGDYATPLDAMVAALKYHARLDLGRVLGTLLAEHAAGLAADGALEPADAVVPVPLAPRRLRERGFNQAEELARALAAGCKHPLVPGLLRRVRDDPPQQSLGRAQRRTNARGAFSVPGRQAPPRVWLVDDVLTTGCTLDAAAACLKQAGARSVINLVVARTP